MTENALILPALLAGCALGAIFFGGLWWTVRRGLTSEVPAAWFLASLPVRMAIALGGFYFAARGDWRKLLACLLGFVIARTLVARTTRLPERGGKTLGQAMFSARVRHALLNVRDFRSGKQSQSSVFRHFDQGS